MILAVAVMRGEIVEAVPPEGPEPRNVPTHRRDFGPGASQLLEPDVASGRLCAEISGATAHCDGRLTAAERESPRAILDDEPRRLSYDPDERLRC